MTVLLPVAVRGDAAGSAAGNNALAVGSLTTGTVVVQTGASGEISGAAGSGDNTLVDVEFTIDLPGTDDPATQTFVVTQTTGAGLAGALAVTVKQRKGIGFSIVPTNAPAANAIYVFAYTSS